MEGNKDNGNTDEGGRVEGMGVPFGGGNAGGTIK